MQSCLEASPFRLRDRPPPAHPGLCPRTSREPRVLQPPSARLLPEHQVTTCGAASCTPCVLLSPLPAPQDRGWMPALPSLNEASVEELTPGHLCCGSGPRREDPWPRWTDLGLVLPAQRVWVGRGHTAPGGKRRGPLRSRTWLAENTQMELRGSPSELSGGAGFKGTGRPLPSTAVR